MGIDLKIHLSRFEADTHLLLRNDANGISSQIVWSAATNPKLLKISLALQPKLISTLELLYGCSKLQFSHMQWGTWVDHPTPSLCSYNIHSQNRTTRQIKQPKNSRLEKAVRQLFQDRCFLTRQAAVCRRLWGGFSIYCEAAVWRWPSDGCFQIGIRRSILAEGVSRYIHDPHSVGSYLISVFALDHNKHIVF